MLFPFPLISGVLLKRYNRFLADIMLDNGQEITAHVANPGAMLDIKTPGLKVWVSHNPSPTRKLQYSWQLVEADDTLVGVSTYWPNLIALEALTHKIIKSLEMFHTIKAEVKYGTNSRIDFLLSSNDPTPRYCYVEVKNVHLKRGAGAFFPDSVTSRGTKHLSELVQMVKLGHRAVMLYIVQRNDCDFLSFASDIDPVYAKCAKQAFENGVEPLAFCCDMSLTGINLGKNIPVKI